MFGFLFIYFIGKYFYQLAENFNQNKWLYAILGIVVYYGGGIVGAFILGIADGIFELNIDWDNTVISTLIALPFGIGSDCLFYLFLRKKWEKAILVKDEIQDIGITQE